MDQGEPEETQEMQQNPIHGNEDDRSSVKSGLADRHSTDSRPLPLFTDDDDDDDDWLPMQQLLRDLLPRRPFLGIALAFAGGLSERVHALGLFCIRCLHAVPLLPSACWKPGPGSIRIKIQERRRGPSTDKTRIDHPPGKSILSFHDTWSWEILT